MFPFCINSMFDILLQKRMFRKGKKYQREKDKMSHYVVMNDKNVKILLLSSTKVVEVETVFGWFVKFYIDICYIFEGLFSSRLANCQITIEK